ncbi:unnamed protein product [Ceratitis capitata]|uniref:(Mediterranean fruit fly) hypothetical protein n=1 Tax=Ceratitis capitata TaxID=7213 RepID=A0A811UXA6_CERCA|nr:unnamed protein product [Ceratitis capitata]
MSHHHTPENRRRHHQLFQRGEQRVQLQRRKSFTDYDNAQLGNCSSSSSMASGGGSTGTPTNELQPRGEKPRKKLSFREPVADRPRVRRRSSPQQQSPSDNAINDTAYGLGVASSTPTTKESNNRLGVEDAILIGNANAHKVSCDNLSAGSASHNAALLSLPDNRSYTGQINNLPLDVSGCCYVDNANLAMDFEVR